MQANKPRPIDPPTHIPHFYHDL